MGGCHVEAKTQESADLYQCVMWRKYVGSGKIGLKEHQIKYSIGAIIT